MKEIMRYKNCFVCGEQNPIGLKARFFFDGFEAKTSIDAIELFEGYPGIYHGGILSTLLDEVMIKALLAQDIVCVTIEMTVKFRRPVKIGDRLTFSGWMTKRQGRVCRTEGKATDESGQVYASAEGKYVVAVGDLKDQLLKANQSD